ncbi:MAG: Uma2 family endonuclease, partial [Chloroflexota bacterium]|nr:Uma2 family endonuclease [Chloroflexota bacterium]
TIQRRLTVRDVAAMLRQGRIDPDLIFELIDGEIIELGPSFSLQSYVSARLVTKLGVFAEVAGGQVFDSSGGFAVGRDRQQLRAPDVSYIGPRHQRPVGREFLDGAADLSVEVLSDRQSGLAYARGKVREYLDAGGQLVWLVDPFNREVRIYEAGSDELRRVSGEGVLTLEPIASGFALKVAELFPPEG